MDRIMNFIIDYWTVFVELAALVAMIVVFVKELMPTSKDEQVKQVKAWLLTAVTLTEKEFGSGTGKIKLSYVYDKFVDRFSWIARAMPFEKFSDYVDEALKEMHELLENNTAVAELIEGTPDVVVEYDDNYDISYHIDVVEEGEL